MRAGAILLALSISLPASVTIELTDAVAFAFDTDPVFVTGPEWIAAERFDPISGRSRSEVLDDLERRADANSIPATDLSDPANRSRASWSGSAASFSAS